MLPASGLAPRRHFAIVCFGYEAARVHKQPWHVARGLALGLGRLGHDVTLLTDAMAPPSDEVFPVLTTRPLLHRGRPSEALRRALADFGPEEAFMVTGAAELARLRRLDLPARVTLVMASPRPYARELARLPLASLWRERRLLVLPLVNALLPGWLLRRGLERSGATRLAYLSRESARRYGALGLPAGPIIVPQVTPWPAAPTGRRLAGPRRIAYLGPPLAVRGVDLAIAAFEHAVDAGLDGRLLLLLRPDAPAATAAWLQRRIAASRHASGIEVEARTLGRAMLGQLLAECDVFLLPFRLPVSEVPLVLIEAGLTGKPVVALEAPGVTEQVERLGGIVARAPSELPQALLAASCRPPRVVDERGWTSWPDAVADLLTPAPRQPLRLLALCGVDGVGKTTLCDRLADLLDGHDRPVLRRWSRFRNHLSRPLLGLARLTGHNRKERHGDTRIGYHDFAEPAVLAWAFLVLQALDQVIDIFLRFRRVSGRHLVIADRSLLDTLVDLAVDTGRDDFVLRRLGPLLVRLLPRPWLGIVVVREPARIVERRPDVLHDRHFARRQALYRRLASELRLPVVDNDGQLEAAVHAILAQIRGGGQ